VALQRDRRFDRVIHTKSEDDYRELRGEIRAIDEMYRLLASYQKKAAPDE
jgi:hypothetical protein